TSVAIVINLTVILMFVALRMYACYYGEGYISFVYFNNWLAALVYLQLKNPMNLSHTACRNNSTGPPVEYDYSLPPSFAVMHTHDTKKNETVVDTEYPGN
ncbi:hypothetical protein DOY81_007928, partial [Sarcophaga bullata]